jgi:hypothetical protein
MRPDAEGFWRVDLLHAMQKGLPRRSRTQVRVDALAQRALDRTGLDGVSELPGLSPTAGLCWPVLRSPTFGQGEPGKPVVNMCRRVTLDDSALCYLP